MWHESTPSHIDSLATTICCENSWMDRCKMFYSNHITITTGTQLDISSAVLACLLLNSFLNWNNVQSLQLQEHSSMMWQVVYLHMDRNADAATCRMPAELCSLIPHCFMFIAHLWWTTTMLMNWICQWQYVICSQFVFCTKNIVRPAFDRW